VVKPPSLAKQKSAHLAEADQRRQPAIFWVVGAAHIEEYVRPGVFISERATAAAHNQLLAMEENPSLSRRSEIVWHYFSAMRASADK
jgi:hypothetical protein